MVNEIFWLLENNGETGIERISSYKLRLPFKVCMKKNLFADSEGSIIFDVFRSDTPSHIAVNNKAGVAIDWAELDKDTCGKIYDILKKVRSDEYAKLVELTNNLRDVENYIREDMDVICDDTMLEYAQENLDKVRKAIALAESLMTVKLEKE